MRDRAEFLSNLAAATVLAVLVAGVGSMLPGAAGKGDAGPPGEMTIALEAAPEPEPPAPASEQSAAPVEQPPEPPPPPVVPPPPPPVPDPPELEEPEEAEQLINAEGAPVAPPPELAPVSEAAVSAFRTCLQKHARYPSTKAARKLKPHGTVTLKISVSGGAVTNIEITTSSGSPILDQAARSSVLNSGCGSLGETGIVTGTIVY